MSDVFKNWVKWINHPTNERVIGKFLVLFGTFEIIAVGVSMWALASYGTGVGVLGTLVTLTGLAVLFSLMLVW